MNVIESIAVALKAVSTAIAIVIDVAATVAVYCLGWISVGFEAIAAACR